MSIDDSEDGLVLTATSTNTTQSPACSNQREICYDSMNNTDSHRPSDFKSKTCLPCTHFFKHTLKSIKIQNANNQNHAK